MIGENMNTLKENISLWQLFILIILFNLGSSIVVNIGAGAGNNSWIAILIACFAGLLLISIYFLILFRFPKLNLFEILEICFGKWLGKLLGIFYSTYFFLIASFVLRDFGELMISTIFEETPIEFITLTMILVILYILILGIEVLGRVAEIFIPYAVTFLIFVGIGISLSGELELKNLSPLLGEGLKPILQEVFRNLIHFPFGEFIAFMVIIPYVTRFNHTVKTGVSAYVLSGFILAYSAILQIATLGPIKNRTNFPLLAAAREISLLNFIERVDLLIVFIMMLGIVVKVAIFFYGGLKGLETIFQIPHRSFGFPIAMIVSLTSITIGKNFASYIYIGIEVIPLYLQTTFQIGIPLLLLTIAFFKKKKRVVTKDESF